MAGRVTGHLAGDGLNALRGAGESCSSAYFLHFGPWFPFLSGTLSAGAHPTRPPTGKPRRAPRRTHMVQIAKYAPPQTETEPESQTETKSQTESQTETQTETETVSQTEASATELFWVLDGERRREIHEYKEYQYKPTDRGLGWGRGVPPSRCAPVS